jgi:UDP-N-acetylglucosamine 2-epimerase (non-hydrolysing)
MMIPTDDPINTAVIFGTRPEAIKLAPLIRRMADKPDRFQPITIVTAQHREMLDQVLALFSIKPDHDLSILRPRQTLAEITASAISGLDSVLSKEKPDVVVVQGDTTTTFVGALSAFYHKIPVVHVEAGLRTQDKTNPFPEEINRRMTSVIADAHCAPTEKALRNLVAEGIGRDRIWLTGNTVVDALKDVVGWSRKCDHPVLNRVAAEKLRMLFVTSHRRENQGKPQEEICRALIELVKIFKDILVVFPVHLSPAVRDTVLPRLKDQDRIVLLDPIDYLETIHFMKNSYLVLTDSGGIQEETSFLGVPCLTLRYNTERPVTIFEGTSTLCGLNEKLIYSSIQKIESGNYKKGKKIKFYDGKTAPRIAKIILNKIIEWT